jgi:hypothetical protein
MAARVWAAPAVQCMMTAGRQAIAQIRCNRYLAHTNRAAAAGTKHGNFAGRTTKKKQSYEEREAVRLCR